MFTRVVSNRWCSVSSGENMLVLWEPSFVYSKGKPVSFCLISKSSDIFLYKSSFCSSNSRVVFCFAHSALPCSSLLTRAYAIPTSYVIYWTATLSWMCVWQLTEAKYGYFTCANASFHKAFINPTEPCVALFMVDVSFPVAQIVEHGASNAKIMGSIPRESKSCKNCNLNASHFG